jgi:hypothetical protein
VKVAKRSKQLLPENHVVRYVSWNKLRKNENDEVIGVLGEAFKMRDSDKSLSVTWIEYFPGDRSEQIAESVQAIRASKLAVKPKSGFAVGQVGAIQRQCSARNYKIRIFHEPEDDNAAHAAVKSLPRDDMELLEELASGAWSECVLNKDIAP